MKALIRGEGETITQGMKIAGINWDTGAPLTHRDWCGGPYVLVNDYVQNDPACDITNDPAPEPAQDPVVEEAVPDTIVIDGVTYTRTP